MITNFDFQAIISTVRGPCSDNILTIEDSVGSGPSEPRPGGDTAATTATMCSGPARGRRFCTRVGSEPSSAGMITSCRYVATISPSSSVSVGGADTAATTATMCSGPARGGRFGSRVGAQPLVQS
jgi:hypothetical protein